MVARKKVPLEKGFSQVEWLRLARSGQDMTGASMWVHCVVCLLMIAALVCLSAGAMDMCPQFTGACVIIERSLATLAVLLTVDSNLQPQCSALH